MRLVIESYGDVVITECREKGYKRWFVDWGKNRQQMFSGLHYTLEEVRHHVERDIRARPI